MVDSQSLHDQSMLKQLGSMLPYYQGGNMNRIMPRIMEKQIAASWLSPYIPWILTWASFKKKTVPVNTTIPCSLNIHLLGS